MLLILNTYDRTIAVPLAEQAGFMTLVNWAVLPSNWRKMGERGWGWGRIVDWMDPWQEVEWGLPPVEGDFEHGRSLLLSSPFVLMEKPVNTKLVVRAVKRNLAAKAA